MSDSISVPAIFRSIAATSVPATSGGQPLHTTRTGYMRSAPNPRAHRRRVAATSAYTSSLSGPYFTLTSSSGGITQVNLGERPVIFLSTHSQLTVASGANEPSPVGPVVMFMAPTLVLVQT